MATRSMEAPACGCGVAHGDGERKAVAVDEAVKDRNLKRLRRIEGQVRGLQRMVDEDRYCADILTQIASVHEALRGVGRELMRNHLKHCATSAMKAGGEEAEAMYDELMPVGEDSQLENRTSYWFFAKGRLKAGVSLAALAGRWLDARARIADRVPGA